MNINSISGGWGATGIDRTQASAARNRFRAVNEAASTYLGLSAEELRGQLANGQSLAQVADANGKSVDDLTQAIADAVAKANPDADAAAIAQRIVSTQPGSGLPTIAGTGGTDFGQRLQRHGATTVDGYSAGSLTSAGGVGGSTLEQLLLEKFASVGGAFRGIDDFA